MRTGSSSPSHLTHITSYFLVRNLRMSGFDFPIRRMGEGHKSGLKKRRQDDLALKSNEIVKVEAKWRNSCRYIQE